MSAWQAVPSDDGSTYYWNTQTNETSWDCPPELMSGGYSGGGGYSAGGGGYSAGGGGYSAGGGGYSAGGGGGGYGSGQSPPGYGGAQGGYSGGGSAKFAGGGLGGGRAKFAQAAKTPTYQGGPSTFGGIQQQSKGRRGSTGGGGGMATQSNDGGPMVRSNVFAGNVGGLYVPGKKNKGVAAQGGGPSRPQGALGPPPGHNSGMRPPPPPKGKQKFQKAGQNKGKPPKLDMKALKKEAKASGGAPGGGGFGMYEGGGGRGVGDFKNQLGGMMAGGKPMLGRPASMPSNMGMGRGMGRGRGGW